MFTRKKINSSGSTSVQIIAKEKGKSKLVKTIGSSSEPRQIELLVKKANQEIKLITGQVSLFRNVDDLNLEAFLDGISNSQIRTVGPELVFGSVFDFIGFNKIGHDLFRYLVISRLAFPLSKLKTVEYLYRYQGVSISIDSIYKFLDKLNSEYKDEVEQISFNHTKKLLNNNISIVFYDMTTLYFEASDEDDFRKTGFSKDGKHSNPQIYLGLLVGLGGYAIGYDIFDGSTYEGHTLIPVLKKLSAKFNLTNPIVVADAGLLNNDNIIDLENEGYKYILGARIKSENKATKDEILKASFEDQKAIEFKRVTNRLIVQYSNKRAKKDEHNRKRGLNRLQKQIKSGNLTKKNINNRGYNKYLKLTGEIAIEIDMERYQLDAKWDGLKGFVTNCDMEANAVIDKYKNLWHIEKAFRMSKTDLRIRPIYHRIRGRIEAHICLSFVAYSIYKELERVLKLEKFDLSIEKAAEITHNIYQLEIVLPESLQSKQVLLKMDQQQAKLVEIVNRNFPRVTQN